MVHKAVESESTNVRNDVVNTPQMVNAAVTLVHTLSSKFSAHKKTGAARCWIAELERGFDLCDKNFRIVFPDCLKVAIAVAKLDATYKKWYSSTPTDVADSWDRFRSLFLEKFEPSYMNMELQIFDLQQGEHQTLEEYYGDFINLVKAAFPDSNTYPNWTFDCFQKGLYTREAFDHILLERSHNKSQPDAVQSAIDFEKSKIAFARAHWHPWTQSQDSKTSVVEPLQSNQNRKKNKVANEAPDAAQISDLTRQIENLTLLVENMKTGKENPHAQRDRRWYSNRAEETGNNNSASASRDVAHVCDEFEIIAENDANDYNIDSGQYFTEAFAVDDNSGEDSTSQQEWDWQAGQHSSEIAIIPQEPVDLAMNAAPMEIDAPLLPPPRNRAGQFSGVPFPASTGNNAVRPAAQQQATLHNNNNARPTNNAGTNTHAGRPNVRQVAPLLRQPANPVPFPSSREHPVRPTQRNTGPQVQHRNQNSTIPMNSNAIAKKVRDAAMHTQVTLSVGQLAELSPAVRSELLNSRSGRNEGAHMVQTAEDVAQSESPIQEACHVQHGHVQGQAQPLYAPAQSIARIVARINHVPQTCIIDTGCSGVMMGIGSVRNCQMIQGIDRDAGRNIRFRVANGQIEAPLGIIRSVPITLGPVTTYTDVTVCNADTDYILLGIRFLKQLNAELKFSPPVLTFTANNLQRMSLPIDFSGAPLALESVFNVEEIAADGNTQALASEGQSTYQVRVHINTFPRDCIIDTGCSRIMMSRAAVRACEISESYIVPASGQTQYTMINGGEVTVSSVIPNMPIRFGNVVILSEVFVYEAEIDQVLLGCSFFRQFHAEMTFGSPQMSFSAHGQRHTVPLSESRSAPYHALMVVEGSQGTYQEPMVAPPGFGSAPPTEQASPLHMRNLGSPPGFDSWVAERAASHQAKAASRLIAQRASSQAKFGLLGRSTVFAAPTTGNSRCSRPTLMLGNRRRQSVQVGGDDTESQETQSRKTGSIGESKTFIAHDSGSKEGNKNLIERKNAGDAGFDTSPSAEHKKKETLSRELQPKILASLEARFGPFIDLSKKCTDMIEVDIGRASGSSPKSEIKTFLGKVVKKRNYELESTPGSNKKTFLLLPDWPQADWWSPLWSDQYFRIISYWPIGADIRYPGEGESAPCGFPWGMIGVLHSTIAPQVPLIPSPKTGFWPPVTAPTAPVRADFQGHGQSQQEPAAEPNTDFHLKVKISEDIGGLEELIDSYEDVFAQRAQDLGQFEWQCHKIDTQKAIPIKNKGRKYSPGERQAMVEEVDKLMEAKVIRPSRSPWSSNPLLVSKPDGTLRMCIDYRQINEVTVKDSYPMPRSDDIFDGVGQAKYFSTIDLKSGFHEIPVAEGDTEKTAFYTPFGQFEYTKMPFGLVNAPATFQRVMDTILAGPCQPFARVYLDDIIVYSHTPQEHLAHVQTILQALRTSGLRANPSKCRFAAKEIAYLGHVISEGRIQPNPDKADSLKDLPVPTNISQLRSVLGLLNYYRRFVQGYAKVAAPLLALLRQNAAFIWTAECQEALDILTTCISKNAVLYRPDFTRPFIVQVDFSTIGLGAVLSQVIDGVERPILFQSRSLTPGEKNYSPVEGEALATVWGISVFRPYIHGTHFKLETDCSALTWLKSRADPPPKLARWLLKLSEYTFDLVHRSGAKNANADGLSRVPQNNTGQDDIMERPMLPLECFHVENAMMMQEIATPTARHDCGGIHDRNKGCHTCGCLNHDPRRACYDDLIGCPCCGCPETFAGDVAYFERHHGNFEDHLDRLEYLRNGRVENAMMVHEFRGPGQHGKPFRSSRDQPRTSVTGRGDERRSTGTERAPHQDKFSPRTADRSYYRRRSLSLDHRSPSLELHYEGDHKYGRRTSPDKELRKYRGRSRECSGQKSPRASLRRPIERNFSRSNSPRPRGRSPNLRGSTPRDRSKSRGHFVRSYSRRSYSPKPRSRVLNRPTHSRSREFDVRDYGRKSYSLEAKNKATNLKGSALRDRSRPRGKLLERNSSPPIEISEDSSEDSSERSYSSDQEATPKVKSHDNKRRSVSPSKGTSDRCHSQRGKSTGKDKSPCREASLNEDYSLDHLLPPVHPEAVCSKCNEEGDPSQLLVCEGCSELVHLACTNPPLEAVPEGDFFCSLCLSEGEGEDSSRVKDITEDLPVIRLLKGLSLEIIPVGDNVARIRKRAKNYLWQDSDGYTGVVKKATKTSSAKKVPKKSDRPAIIAACHQGCGHFGIKRVESLLSLKYSWAGMRQDIAFHINNCVECQKVKGKFTSDPTLHSIPVEPKAWHTVGIDIAGPFPLAESGNRYLIVAIDYLTKWIEAKPMPDQTSKSAAEFLDGLLNRFGAMAVLRSDQGRHFQGHFEKVLQENMIDHRVSRPYHPQANGQAERSVRTVVESLRKSIPEDQEHMWDKELPKLLRGYNMSTQASTRMSPFFLMHGWQPALPYCSPELQQEEYDLQDQAGTQEKTQSARNVPELSEDVLRRQTQIAGVASKRAEAAKNIKVAQGRQATAFNKRKGIANTADVPEPRTLFNKNDLVLTREHNKSTSLNPGELAGQKKLRGMVKGPFKYQEPLSERYCRIVDFAGNQWDKPFHDVIHATKGNDASKYSTKDFSLSSAKAQKLNQVWDAEAKAAEAEAAQAADVAEDTEARQVDEESPSRRTRQRLNREEAEYSPST